MKKSIRDNSREPASTITTLVVESAENNTFSQMKEKEPVNMDTPLLVELLKAFDLAKENQNMTIETESKWMQSRAQKGSSADPIVKRANAAKTMRTHLRSFNSKNYSRLKTSKIICGNGGTKLTFETLAELAHAGARLIPSLSL